MLEVIRVEDELLYNLAIDPNVLASVLGALRPLKRPGQTITLMCRSFWNGLGINQSSWLHMFMVIQIAAEQVYKFPIGSAGVGPQTAAQRAPFATPFRARENENERIRRLRRRLTKGKVNRPLDQGLAVPLVLVLVLPPVKWLFTRRPKNAASRGKSAPTHRPFIKTIFIFFFPPPFQLDPKYHHDFFFFYIS